MDIMDEKQTSKFGIGFLIGLLLCIILWYWQKSTAAEDGALELLDRYATKEREWQEKKTEGQVAVATPPLIPSVPPTPFDFIPIKGIGPAFNQRLHEAGITTLDSLLALSAGALGDLLDIGLNRAQAILTAAQTHPNA